MRKFSRPIALLLSVITVMSVFIGCNGKSDNDYYEPVADVYDDDRGVIDSIGDKMEEAIVSVFQSGCKSAGTSIGTWAYKGILNALGFEYGKDYTLEYVKQCLEKLTEIENSIGDIKEELSEIKEISNDSKYSAVYEYYVSCYNNLCSDAKTAYKTFVELNKKSEDKSIDEATLATKCEEFDSILSNQYPSLEKEVLTLGYSVLGNTSQSSKTTKYSIMDTMRYFAEEETPFRNQRYEIENSVIVPTMTLYDYGHQMIIWDLAYKLEDYGVTSIYTAADGTVIGFKYIPKGKTTEEKYQCSLSDISDFSSKYSSDLKELELNNAEFVDADDKLGITAYNLLVRYEELKQQKVSVWNKHDSMPHEKIKDNTNVLETLDNKEINTEVKTITCKDFLQPYNGVSGQRTSTKSYYDFKINCDVAKVMTKNEFIKFVDAIKGYAGNRTFREFLTDSGFDFPTNNKSDYWLIGFNSDGYYELSSTWNHGYRAYSKYIAKNHSFNSISVKLDEKISDFAKNQDFVKVQYFSQIDYVNHYTTCGKYDYTTYENPIIVESATLEYEPKGDWDVAAVSTDGKNYSSSAIKYYTIGGIGNTISGSVHALDTNNYWNKQ